MAETITRVCTKCGERQPFDAFHRQTSGSEKRDASCKKCANAQVRAWQLNNPERSLEHARRSREKRRKPPRVSDLVTGVRTCSRCKIEKLIAAFPPKPGGRDGINAACRACISTANKARYLKHHDRELARGRMRAVRDREKIREYSRHYRMLVRFGITVADWERLFESQGKACAICKRLDPDGRHWHTDHCHETGKLRGILCRRCNLGLGWFDDSTEKLRDATQYLHDHRSLAAGPRGSAEC